MNQTSSANTLAATSGAALIAPLIEWVANSRLNMAMPLLTHEQLRTIDDLLWKIAKEASNGVLDGEFLKDLQFRTPEITKRLLNDVRLIGDERDSLRAALAETHPIYAEHSAAWVRVIQMMLREWNAHVLCVPHVQESYGDDRILATRVFRELGFDDRVHLAAVIFQRQNTKL